MNSTSFQLSHVLELVNQKKQQSKAVVFTNGCFDLLHVGHTRYLREAKSQGNFLVVGLNSDASVSQLKGPSRPVQTELDRAEILCSLESVDAVVIFSEETPIKLIEALKPDVLVKGGDWAIKDIVGGTFVQGYGGSVRSLSFIDGKSTTSIIERSQETN